LEYSKPDGRGELGLDAQAPVTGEEKVKRTVLMKEPHFPEEIMISRGCGGESGDSLERRKRGRCQALRIVKGSSKRTGVGKGRSGRHGGRKNSLSGKKRAHGGLKH